MLSRAGEELTRFNASIRRNPYIDYDEDQRLSIKWKDRKNTHNTQMWACSNYY